MEERERIARYSVLYEGDWMKIAEALRAGRPVPSFRIRDPFLTILDEDYPAEFRTLRYPPWVMFYRGNPDLLKKPKAAIVGSRKLGEYGRRATGMAADLLKKRYVLVSGLAKGADAEVHFRALKGGETIGIIGSGLGTCYPACNRDLYRQIGEQGLILSEYPHDTGVRKNHFPWRNRLIAALGEFLVVTQAAEHSGTMLTVNETAALGKDIYCFPYPFDDPDGRGCNRLIADGAIAVYDCSLLADLRPRHSVQVAT